MKKLEFPKGFMWGAATSSHQVEGGNKWNDWWQFEKNGHVKNKEVSGDACDHYNRYEEDFDIAKSLNMNTQRISIEWSRIEKQKGKIDKKEIEHYKNVLKYLKDNGFSTIVTLHHFTNPSWFLEEGGWTSEKSPEYFKKYVEAVVPELDLYVDYWITFNEPVVLLSACYLGAVFPPKKINPFKYVKSANNLALAHNISYEAMKKINKKTKIGICEHMSPPYSKTKIGRILQTPINYLANHYILDKAAEKTDYLAMNYYSPLRTWPFIGLERTDFNWPIHAPSYYFALTNNYKRYNKPIIITENGIADAKDEKRKDYIKDHLAQVHKAIQDGVDIRGYMHWSLLDNFEWAEGFAMRFGLIEIDYKTQKRTVRESAKYYAEICKNNYLEVD